MRVYLSVFRVSCACLLIAGCGPKSRPIPPALDAGSDESEDAGGDSDTDTDSDSASDSDSDTGGETDTEPDALELRAIGPDHGPVVGGTQVEVRGAGFIGELVVRFGGRQVQPADLESIDDHRLLAKTPAGEIGPADVEVDRGDGTPAVLQDGFTYDEIYVDPGRGSIAGGTRVSVIGASTTFDPSDVVIIDGNRASDITWVSETRIDCRTPPGTEGTADVEVEGPGGDHLLEDGFLYYNAADPFGGGLGGGSLQGTMNVTVVSAGTALPVESAFVMLGVEGDTYQGLTDANGQITFSGDDLLGRQSLTAGKEGYAPSSIVEFDATDVTIFLFPLPDPAPPQPPPSVYAAAVEGELMFFSDMDVGWTNVPEPIGPEEKIAYVFTTKPNILVDEVPPGDDSVVRETDEPGANGYPFELVARPGAFAVWALAGLRNILTDEFTPYVMGVARDVLAGPAETVTGVLVDMSIPLDHLVTVRLVDPPGGGVLGPDRYRVDTFIDLGGEGVIARPDSVRRARSGLLDFEFPWQPPLDGALVDARFLFVAGGYQGDNGEVNFYEEYNPFSWRIQGGFMQVNDPIVIGDFLGAPSAVDPTFGGDVQDGVLRWEGDGATPTFQHVVVQTLDFPPAPVWDMIVRGDVDEARMPDLTAIAGLPAPPTGQNMWIVVRYTVPNIGFDDFSYAYLNPYYASAYAADAFLLNFP